MIIHQRTHLLLLRKLLNKILNFFFFNGKLYKQVDVVAMGSPLGPILAYAFLVNLLYKCSSEQGLITTSGMLMNSLSWLPNQNIQKTSETFRMFDMLTCHLQLKMKSKTDCSFPMHTLFVNTKHLPVICAINLP